MTDDQFDRLFKHISKEVGSVRDALNDFKVEVYHRFDQIDLRFEAIEKRLDEHDARFDAIDARFDENEITQNEILNTIAKDNTKRDKRISRLEKLLPI